MYCRVVFFRCFACEPDRERTPRWPSRRSRQARVVSANSLGQIGAASGHKRLASLHPRTLSVMFTLSDHLDSNTPCVRKICSSTRMIKTVYRAGLQSKALTISSQWPVDHYHIWSKERVELRGCGQLPFPFP